MKGRINAVIVAAVLLVLGVTIAAVSLSKVGWDFSKHSTANMRKDVAVVEEEFHSIEVDVTTADVHVRPSPDDACRVHIYEQKHMPIRVEVKDGILRIWQEDNRLWYDHIEIGYTPNSRVEITLSETVYDTFLFEMTTGDVMVSDAFQFRCVTGNLTTGDVDYRAQVTEMLDLHATTGDVRVAAGTSEADIIIRVATGDITVRDTVCRSLELKATTGDTQLKLCDAQTIQASATTGDVTGILLSGKKFRAHTTTGDVDIPADETSGVCDIHTTTGDIKIDIKEAGD